MTFTELDIEITEPDHDDILGIDQGLLCQGTSDETSGIFFKWFLTHVGVDNAEDTEDVALNRDVSWQWSATPPHALNFTHDLDRSGDVICGTGFLILQGKDVQSDDDPDLLDDITKSGFDGGTPLANPTSPMRIHIVKANITRPDPNLDDEDGGSSGIQVSSPFIIAFQCCQKPIWNLWRSEKKTGITGYTYSLTETPDNNKVDRIMKEVSGGTRTLLVQGTDYTVSGSQITLTVAAISSDIFHNSYMKSTSGGRAPQITGLIWGEYEGDTTKDEENFDGLHYKLEWTQGSGYTEIFNSDDDLVEYYYDPSSSGVYSNDDDPLGDWPAMIKTTGIIGSTGTYTLKLTVSRGAVSRTDTLEIEVV